MSFTKENDMDRYKDPRWLSKSFEIKKDADFKCERCRARNCSLETHHLFYKPAHELWDYPNWSLICLCSNCHDFIHQREDGTMELDWD